MNQLKFLLIPDKFKGSLTSFEVSQALATSLFTSHKVEMFSVSDGGQGFLDTIQQFRNIEVVKEKIHDPLGREITASWGWDRKTDEAFVEASQAVGFHLLLAHELDIFHASSASLGNLLKKVLTRKPKGIFIGIGGTATCDAGVGFLSEMGISFYDQDQRPLVGKLENLSKIVSIECEKEFKIPPVTILVDVKNPISGNNSGVKKYTYQKGYFGDKLSGIQSQIDYFTKLMESYYDRDLRSLIGGGAGGGLGMALSAFFHVSPISGSDWVIQQLNLKNRVVNADVIITGEGCFDGENHDGKIPSEIIKIAQKHNKICILVTGKKRDIPKPFQVLEWFSIEENLPCQLTDEDPNMFSLKRISKRILEKMTI